MRLRDHLESLAVWFLAALGCGFCAMFWQGVVRSTCTFLSGLCVGALAMALHVGAKGGAA